MGIKVRVTNQEEQLIEPAIPGAPNPAAEAVVAGTLNLAGAAADLPRTIKNAEVAGYQQAEADLNKKEAEGSCWSKSQLSYCWDGFVCSR